MRARTLLLHLLRLLSASAQSTSLAYFEKQRSGDSMCFPTELETLQDHIAEHWPCPTCCSSIPWHWTTSLAALHLINSRRLNLVEILPGALYRCVTEYSLSDIFSVVATPNTEYKYPYPLTPEDFKLCFKLEASEYLAGRVRRIQRIISNSKTAWECKNPYHCTSATTTMALEFQERFPYTERDALHRMRSWLMRFEKANRSQPVGAILPPNCLCRACEAGKLALIEEHQRETWKYLRTELCASTVSRSMPTTLIYLCLKRCLLIISRC